MIKNLFTRISYLLFLFVLLADLPVRADEQKLSVLIIDGRNNHDWRITTEALRASLENSGRFEVSVSRAPENKVYKGPRRPNDKDPAIQAAYEEAEKAYRKSVEPVKQASKEAWEQWSPKFKEHDVILLNYNGPDWPEGMRKNFVTYVREGGGVVLVHAANNAFSRWDEFNEMIGMGWRKEDYGKSLKIDPKSGKTIEDSGAGNSGHGSKHPFQVTVRKPDHPVMKGLPPVWMHGKDELYHNMRGPAGNLTVLSSAFSDSKKGGTGKHEPMTWEVAFGKGRVIVTSMGHFWPGQEDLEGLNCVGFQTVLNRSAEYVATGKVSLPVPEGFPQADQVSALSPYQVTWGKGESTREELNAAWKKKKEADPFSMLTPEESRESLVMAEGFVAELAASEPMVQEPVLTVWDGNGAMYVAEMSSYMQDEKGTGTKELKNGRIKRLVDSNGDGTMDQVTVFAEGLNLPRAILPLDDRIAVRETDSTRVWSFRDTDGDGVADEKTVLFEGKEIPATKSVEHQDSGLIWNLDNHIYISYGSERYRFTDGEWKVEKQRGLWGQWGLDRDDVGRIFYSGNSEPVKALQVPRKYWNTPGRLSKSGLPSGDFVSIGDPHEVDFMSVRSLCLLNDRGGATSDPRAFTSACGQSVFRGQGLSLGGYGNYFICDPTIHTVRRAKVENRSGQIFVTKAEEEGEFMMSSDINFRPVNSATGPDGALYITDMYRGIIQDSPWLSPGPRKFIKESGLSDNNQHGRIWRVRHQDYQPTGQPRMLDESTVELLRHLQNPNGWWRDTAQKLIVLRKDRDSVAGLLADMVRFEQDPIARLHALWTLEGMDAVNQDLLKVTFADRDPRVRSAGVQISERYLAEENYFADLSFLKKERDAVVAKQGVLSLGLSDDKRAVDLIQELAGNHIGDKGVMMAATLSLWKMEDLPLIKKVKEGSAFAIIKNEADRQVAGVNWLAAIANWKKGLVFPEDMPKEQQNQIKSGQNTYFNNCVACHAADGKGTRVPGTDLYLAPSLAGSKRVSGPIEGLIPVLLHGLIGPIEGKTYQAGFMAPAVGMGITRDDRLAEVLSYLRYALNDDAGMISKDEVKAMRQSMSDRKAPWTDEELKKFTAEAVAK